MMAKRRRRINTLGLLCLVVWWAYWPCTLSAAEVFKYKDEQGRWHFTDKKPRDPHEKLTLGSTTSVRPAPTLVYDTASGKADGKRPPQLIATNPWHAPVEFVLLATATQSEPVSLVVGPNTTQAIALEGPLLGLSGSFRYQYYMGDPNITPDNYVYWPPLPSPGKFRISQSFNGHFSHQREPNTYAVDIAMQVGTPIHAARAGVVADVKADYHMGGTSSTYFADKANYVSIVHQDGTMAIYAHVLLDSLMVKPGDSVEAGDPIARAGSSGFSTGPHLHFVIRRNVGGKIVSVPFRFMHNNTAAVPVAGEWLRAAASSGQ